jgi:hypothetical protein
MSRIGSIDVVTIYIQSTITQDSQGFVGMNFIEFLCTLSDVPVVSAGLKKMSSLKIH